VRVLATLLRPDGGTARVLGHDVVTEDAAVRRRVALTGRASPPPWMRTCPSWNAPSMH